MDGGPCQFKAILSYVPIGDGRFVAIEFGGINFDWTLDGLKSSATHGTTLNGVVETNGNSIEFVLVAYALDDSSKAIYILKAVGSITVVDQDTLNVENLVFNFYNDPETANPIADESDFCVPHNGTFPPIREYRIKLKK